MNRKSFVRVTVISLLIIFFCLFIRCRGSIKIDNTVPANQIITVNHGLEKALLAEAVFRVCDGFGDVTTSQLSKNVGLKLECKRQVSETEFYYVIKGDGYRCFIFTNSSEVVQEVVVARDFVTTEKMKYLVSQYGYTTRIADTAEDGMRWICRDIGMSSVYRNILFTLEDGVMIMRFIGEIVGPKFLYFTDEEWMTVHNEWEGFLILPIDKVPW